MLITDNLLLNYKRCNRRTFLEIYGDRQTRDLEKDFLLKLKRENQTHIKNVIHNRWINSENGDIFNCQKPQASRRDWQLNAEQTIELMKAGAEYISYGVLSITFAQWQTLLKEDYFAEKLSLEEQIFFKELIVNSFSILIKDFGNPFSLIKN